MKPQDLIETGKKLEEAGTEYAESSKEFQEAEEEYKIIRAKIMNMDRVANLNNQALREAESDIILQTDERFEPLYRRYLMAKLRQRQAWILFDVKKELNENVRAMLNFSTFGKEADK